jgi:hypothetical protein
MATEVLIGEEWITVDESATEIMDDLEAISRRASSVPLRDTWLGMTEAGSGRRIDIVPAVIKALREVGVPGSSD